MHSVSVCLPLRFQSTLTEQVGETTLLVVSTAIMRIGKQSASSAHRKWEERRLQMAEKRGNRFNVIDPAEVAKMRAAAQPAIDKWVSDVTKKGYDGKALLPEARALIGKYTKQTMMK